jgi:hypothetical protein
VTLIFTFARACVPSQKVAVESDVEEESDQDFAPDEDHEPDDGLSPAVRELMKKLAAGPWRAGISIHGLTGKFFVQVLRSRWTQARGGTRLPQGLVRIYIVYEKISKPALYPGHLCLPDAFSAFAVCRRIEQVELRSKDTHDTSWFAGESLHQ